MACATSSTLYLWKRYWIRRMREVGCQSFLLKSASTTVGRSVESAANFDASSLSVAFKSQLVFTASAVRLTLITATTATARIKPQEQYRDRARRSQQAHLRCRRLQGQNCGERQALACNARTELRDGLPKPEQGKVTMDKETMPLCRRS